MYHVHQHASSASAMSAMCLVQCSRSLQTVSRCACPFALTVVAAQIPPKGFHPLAVVCAYGQTGGGKTYQIMTLFTTLVKNLLAKPLDVNLRVSVVEFLGDEKPNDLLMSEQAVEYRPGKALEAGCWGTTTRCIASSTDIDSIAELLNTKRSQASTGRNDASSRKHLMMLLVSLDSPVRFPWADDR